MKKYTINGEVYLLVDGKLYREVEPSIDEDGTSAPLRVKIESNLPLNSPGKKRKQRLCSVCHKPGHTAQSCRKNQPSTYGFEDDEDSTPNNKSGVDEATVKHIKELYAEGKSMKEIKEFTGVSYPTIGKYTAELRRERERREREDDDLDPDPEDDGMDDEDNF